MGREVRRVPLDFDAPLHTVWAGYVMPEALTLPECADCGGRGETYAAQWVGAIVSLLLMLGEPRADRALHPWLANLPLAPHRPPGPQAADLTGALAGRAPRPWGHDACDRWAATQKIVEAAGLPADWGLCATCAGHGVTATAAQREAHDAWAPVDPPTGEGWQLWETVSEGAPISPVCASAAALAQWMTRHRCTVTGPMASYDQALAFVEQGWAPSFVFTSTHGFEDGTSYVARTTDPPSTQESTRT